MIGLKTTVDDGTSKRIAEIRKQLKLLAKYRLVVMFDENATEEDGTLVEKIAVWLEYGSDSFNVHYPARPFWRSALDGNVDSIKKRFIFNANRVFSGNMNARKCFEDIGEQVIAIIKKSILEGSYAPLAESTAKSRARRGKGTQPLVDTRTMLGNLKYEVTEV